MKLGDIARVSRGIVTGNRQVFVMSRSEARQRGIEKFMRPVLDGARDIPGGEAPSVGDRDSRRLVLLATPQDVSLHDALKAYLGDVVPKVAAFKPCPIVTTYVGVPRFAANPDGLVVLNSLYCVRPNEHLSLKQISELVRRLNRAAAKLPTSRFAVRRTPSDFSALEI